MRIQRTKNGINEHVSFTTVGLVGDCGSINIGNISFRKHPDTKVSELMDAAIWAIYLSGRRAMNWSASENRKIIFNCKGKSQSMELALSRKGKSVWTWLAHYNRKEFLIRVQQVSAKQMISLQKKFNNNNNFGWEVKNGY